MKPNREPDYIDSRGGYYWFDELLYLSGSTSAWHELEIHPTYNKLILKNYPRKCGWCDECDNKRICKNAYIDDKAEEARQKWITNLFESNFLGKDNK